MIYSIINQKGGVAKTTSTFNLGKIIASFGKRVLLIDLDPQSSLSISFGIFNTEKSTYNVLCCNDDINECIKHLDDNLHIIPSNQDLARADLELVSAISRENILKNEIESIKNKYDVILIDCPPALSLLTVNSLSASDEVVVPCSTDYLSYRGMELLFDTVENIRLKLNKKLKIRGIIATMHNTRTKHSSEMLEELQRTHNVIGVIKHSVSLKDSLVAGESIVEFDKHHDAAKEYLKIAKELA